MPDQPIGTAVLDLTNEVQMLYLALGGGAMGSLYFTGIPVYPKGTPKPKTRTSASWSYVFVGPKRLRIEPCLILVKPVPPTNRLATFCTSDPWEISFEYGLPFVGEKCCTGEECYVQFREQNPTVDFR